MKQPQPSTPFSTPLSGSARQAEARIRNLFQCEKKRPPLPLLFLAALFILSCGWLVSCRSQPADPLVVMEVQHYDTNSNYLEIPTLVLPESRRGADLHQPGPVRPAGQLPPAPGGPPSIRYGWV